MDIHYYIRMWYEQWTSVNHLYTKFATKYHITLTTFDVLYEMYHHSESFSQKDISEKLSIAKQTLSNAMTVLEKRGWIERQKSTTDKRLYIFSLTPLGISFCKEMFSEIEQIEYFAFESLSNEERELFTKVNVKLTKLIEEGMCRGENNGN